MSTAHPDGQRSTLHLWAPCVSMLLLSFISYVDRSVLAILSPTILRDLHMSATDYGFAISVFSICYMLANPIWGLWMDRAGLFTTTLIAVTLWSIASASHAAIGHEHVGAFGISAFAGMCFGRGLLGFGEGATFPAGLKTVAETLPPEKRSFGLGLAYSGGSLGAALTPLLVTPLAARYGWRWAFVLTSATGFVWIILWFALRKNGLYRPPAAPSLTERTQWSRTLFNRALFGSAAAYGLGAAPLVFGLYAAPLYLSRVLHISQAELGHLLWIPPAGWEAGYLIWGRVADARKRNANGRPVSLFILFCVAGVFMGSIPLFAQTPQALLITMVLFFLAMFVAGGFVVLSLADGLALQPVGNAGFLAGFCISCWALLTAILMPMIGHLFDAARYPISFLIVACLPPVGVLLWWQLTYAATHENLPQNTR